MNSKNTFKVAKTALPQFIKNHCEDLTAAEIAEKSGWSLYMVNNIFKELGIVPTTIGEQTIKKIKGLVHLPLSEISKIVNLHETRVRQYFKELGIKPIVDRPKAPEEKKAEDSSPKEKVIQSIDAMKMKEEDYLGPIARRYTREQTLDTVNRMLYGNSH